MSNWRTILAIDHDAKACETYRANVACDDVRCGNVVDHLGAMTPGMADVILGGPPCQPYSTAGKQQGDDDERDCVPDFCAAVERVMPRMFLMEQVDAFAVQEKFRVVYQRNVARLADAGYVVVAKVLDAVNFGVPQFRKRVWVWGIRSDLHDVGTRHRWPKPSHVWPWPAQPCMFGGDLLPAVTVGQALGINGTYDAQNEREHGADEPCGTLQGNAQSKGGRAGHYAIQSHADPAQSIASPSPSLRSGGAGHDGCCVRLVVGGGSNPRFSGDARTERDITGEPCTTIPAGHTHNAVPAMHEYRWSDAMREKHPPASPASPASPAPTVQAKWYKGGAEGLVCADGRTWEDRHPPSEPSVTLRGRSPRDAGRCVEGVVRDGPLVRRLTPDECARLQSMPDGFVWPRSVAKTHRYRIVGNGWASLMALRMSQSFKQADPASETVIDLFCGGGCGAVGWHGKAWEYRT